MTSTRDTTHVPRPELRLGLAAMLGLLGAWLMPGEIGGFALVPSNRHSPALLAWLAAAFAGVIVLRRVDRARLTLRLVAIMAITLALTLVRTTPADMYSIVDGRAFAKWIALGLLLLLAGMPEAGARTPIAAIRPWWEFLVRGPALALASPLVLFASRPGAATPPAPGAMLQRGLFVAFLCLVASRLLLWSDDYPAIVLRHVDVRRVGLACQAFSNWAWLGCAVLFLLTPWPDAPRLGEPADRVAANRAKAWALPGLTVAALAVLVVIKPSVLAAVALYAAMLFGVGWAALALLVLVCPCRQHPARPAMGRLAPGQGMGPVGTPLFLALALVPFAAYSHGFVAAVFSGRLFDFAFDQRCVGWALDQSTIQSGFWRLGYFALIASAHVATARWLSDRTTRPGYWAFALPTVALFICLLSYLTSTFYMLLAYIGALGITPLRIYGVACGLGCYAALLAFLRWALKPPRREEEA